MRCTSPKKMSFDHNGNITFSYSKADKAIIPISIPCGKCIACMLEYSRQWAIRCYHESLTSVSDLSNVFITLTYSDKNLTSNRLIKKDFTDFLERAKYNLGYRALYACGEYGKKTQRPHWHAILFDFPLKDLKFYSKNKHGHPLFTSETLDDLWPYNEKTFPNKIGLVDYGSAAYVARYHAKGLIHGNKQEQQTDGLSPISIKTRGLGKTFLEQHWKDVFSYGYIIHNGTKHSIPRYYERWFEANHPSHYLDYVTQVKIPAIKRGEILGDIQHERWINHPERQIHPLKTREEILNIKTRKLMRDRTD